MRRYNHKETKNKARNAANTTTKAKRIDPIHTIERRRHNDRDSHSTTNNSYPLHSDSGRVLTIYYIRGVNNMRRINKQVTSNGQTLYTMTHYNKIYTFHEIRNENGGNIRWKGELKPLRNIPIDKKHYYYFEGF